MTNDFDFESKGIDVEALMKRLRVRVDEKRKAGVYEKYNLDNLTALEFESLEDEKEFLRYYLRLIQSTCDINIGDFEIVNKGGLFGRPVILLKKVIWKLLKFYTYRLFSQQKEFNCQTVNTIMSLQNKLEKDLEEIRLRLNRLEGKSSGEKEKNTSVAGKVS
ncbi:MAG: hypothetical protein P9M03_01145 [Candidatus Theseobacter exili]|nr:hypothetical protein [Candidatus Theseobacter exili]